MSKWKFPSVRVDRAQPPFDEILFSFNRYWHGRIWSIRIGVWTVVLDFRRSWISDMGDSNEQG